MADAFNGKWNVLESRLPDGKPAYTGGIEIRRKGETYDLEWVISAGRYVGIGLAVGEHLLVSCGEQRAGLGIAHYPLQPGGEVSIRWSTPELQGETGSGRFTSPYGGSFEGEHEALQYLPDGSRYGTWTIAIRKTGSLYEVKWRKGEAVHFAGLGFEVAGGLAVGWYPDVHQLAFLDYMPDPQDANRLSASWALGGYTSLGTEVIERIAA
jgi:hypothetical protein